MKFLHFLKLKKVWIPLILVILVVGSVYYQQQKNSKPTYSQEDVSKQDLIQTVSATGTVKSAEEINLNFKTSGKINKIYVKVGDKVKIGDKLVSLESNDAATTILSARANLKQAEAALAKLKFGAQTEDVAVTQASVEAAKISLVNAKQAYTNTVSTQAQNVTNTFSQLMGLAAQAIPAKENISTATLAITGTYNGKEKGLYTIRLDNPVSLTYSISGLELNYGSTGSRTAPTPLGTKGLYIQFGASGTLAANDVWTIELPNTLSASYSTYESAYQSALTSQKQQVDAAEAVVKQAEQTLAQTEAQLNLKTAPARSYDILSAEAGVASAQAALQRASNDLADRTINAPVAGIITKVNSEVGETNSLTQPVMILLADSKQEIKVQVPESDIAKLQVGQKADITFDALGSNEHFNGHVAFIDPASTVIQDVVYYEVTVLFDSNDERIKPGMTANVDIESGRKNDVLVIPLRAVKYDNKKPYVEVLSGEQVVRKDIETGLKGDDGLVELISGLSLGDKVITFKTNGK